METGWDIMRNQLLRSLRVSFDKYLGRFSSSCDRGERGGEGRNPGIRGAVSEAEGQRVLDLDIFDEIDSWWGVGPEEVSGVLREAGSVDRIDVRLNSPGGNVFDGMAVFNLLKGHSAPVNVDVIGLAASMASVVAMAGDSIRVSEGAWMMVHACWGVAVGNAKVMRSMADVLDGLTGEISGIYQRQSGSSDDVVDQWIADETWFNGEQAVEAGLADTVGESVSAEATGSIALSAYGYTHVPESLQGAENNRPKPVVEPEVVPEVVPRFENKKRQLRLLELETRI